MYKKPFAELVSVEAVSVVLASFEEEEAEPECSNETGGR